MRLALPIEQVVGTGDRRARLLYGPGETAHPRGISRLTYRMTQTSRSLLHVIGSLWLGAVILLLLLVAMACATVHETEFSADRALAVFYKSDWFLGLLWLFAVNVTASLLLRLPFTRHQIGFVLTHVGILITLGGALVTQVWGINGQVGIREGETSSQFVDGDRVILRVRHQETGESESVLLPGGLFTGFYAVNSPSAPELVLEDLRAEVLRYLPDAELTERVLDDNPAPTPGVLVSYSADGLADPVWLLAGSTGLVGSAAARFRPVSEEELAALLTGAAEAQPEDVAHVKVEYESQVFTFDLEACTAAAQPVGDTGYTVRVLRYLPHAQVGADSKLVNVSDQPVNPAIEVELAAPDGSVTQKPAFAKFPDFGGMHHQAQEAGPRITFVTEIDRAPGNPVEVLAAPNGRLFGRFSRIRHPVVMQELTLGESVPTPWEDKRFSVLERYENARVETVVKLVEPIRERREPAILVRLTRGDTTEEVWLFRNGGNQAELGGERYALRFEEKVTELGFELTLDEFSIGYYPGRRQPRSFVSRVTVYEPATGVSESRIISMNHPTKFGRYTLYQSSYRQGGEGRPDASFLSVAWDPGQPIVYTGYFTVLIGMVVVLVTRMVAHRRRLHAQLAVAA